MIKKIFTVMLALSILLISGCTDNNEEISYDVYDMEWNEIEEIARGTEVNLYMWGGDSNTNDYIDNIVKPYVKEKHDITLTRVPMDINLVLQKMQTEKQANLSQGTMDVIWINGENFEYAKENELLFGSIIDILPNVEYINKNADFLYNDIGYEIEGYEVPWGNVQYVAHYNADKVSNPPTSFSELLEFAKNNSGVVTYPNPETDFTGTTFIKHLLYELEGENVSSMTPFEIDSAVWDYLNELDEYLWRSGSTYPENLTSLDRMYANGEVWFTFGFNEARAQELVDNGTFPQNTKSFVFDSGSIGNTHYLSMPFNTPNPAGALVVINELISPEMQLEKLKPENWGDGTVIGLENLDEELRAEFEAIDRGDTVLSNSELEKSNVPDLDSSWTEYIRENWLKEVGK